MNNSHLILLEITEADFINFNTFDAISGQYFCPNCKDSKQSNETDDDGYTFCCSSPIASRQDILIGMKCLDVEVTINKNIVNNRDKIYALSKSSRNMDFGNASKNIRFKLDLSQSPNTLIRELNRLTLSV